MIILFDCGNTFIKIAIVKNNQIIDTYHLKTDINKSADDYYLDLKQFILNETPSSVAISSVVPIITDELVRLVNKYFKIDPIVVAPGIKTGIFIKSDNPSEVGADLICDAVYPSGDGIIIDLGTCNKYIYVENNKLSGVAITPGVRIKQEALNKKTALLPYITVKKPKKVLATNTQDAISSGAFYSLVAEINHITNAIISEVGKKPPIYLTGGVAPLILDELSIKVNYVKNLTLEGLLLIHNKNKGE